MPIQQNPNKRRGEERSETLIIPHITREMLEVARAMAEKGASRAEIEAALAAMQTGKAPAAPAAPAPEKQPGAPQQPAPGRSDAARSGGIIPTSRPRYTAAERRAMLEEVQRRQAERDGRPPGGSPGRGGSVPQLPGPGVRQEPRGHTVRSTPAHSRCPQRARRPAAADETRTISIPKRRTAEPAAHAVQPPAPAATARPAAHAGHAAGTKGGPCGTGCARPGRAHRPPGADPCAEVAQKASASRSYAAAEAALNERIRARPYLAVQPRALCAASAWLPVIGAALDGRRALMLCIASPDAWSPSPVCWPWPVCHLTQEPLPPGHVLLLLRRCCTSLRLRAAVRSCSAADLSLLGIYLPLIGRGARHRQAHGILPTLNP